MRTCLNCKWVRQRGPHLSCFYNGKYQRHLPKKKAEMFAVCELPEYKFDVLGEKTQFGEYESESPPRKSL